MKKIVLAGITLILSFSFAQNDPSSYYVDLSNPEDLVNPNDYYEYMIIKGDYLWFISDQFYGDPLKWTKIYEANPYIINPDWIYPNNWLVIPNIYMDKNGNPVYSTMEPETEPTIVSKPTMLVVFDGDDIVFDNGEPVVIEGYGIDLNNDGKIDGYDTDGDGKIDISADDALTFEQYSASKTKSETSESVEATTETETTTTVALATETKMTEEKTKHEHKHKDCKCADSCECEHSYCGKPGWSLGFHAGFPLGSAPEDESLNVGLLLGTPLGVRLGALQVGLGAGAITYNFEDVYLGGGMLASLCLNDLFKLKSPLKLQLHGAGFYVFGEESGPGFGLIGSGSLPISDSPLNIGLYGGLGKYYPGDNDYDWGNVGAVLFYKF